MVWNFTMWSNISLCCFAKVNQSSTRLDNVYSGFFRYFNFYDWNLSDWHEINTTTELCRTYNKYKGRLGFLEGCLFLGRRYSLVFHLQRQLMWLWLYISWFSLFAEHTSLKHLRNVHYNLSYVFPMSNFIAMYPTLLSWKNSSGFHELWRCSYMSLFYVNALWREEINLESTASNLMGRSL